METKNKLTFINSNISRKRIYVILQLKEIVIPKERETVISYIKEGTFQHLKALEEFEQRPFVD